MATNFSPSSGSYVLNKFPNISQWSDTGPSLPSCSVTRHSVMKIKKSISADDRCKEYLCKVSFHLVEWIRRNSFVPTNKQVHVKANRLAENAKTKSDRLRYVSGSVAYKSYIHFT